MECRTRWQARRHLVAELGTSKSGGTVSQLGCSTSVACHRNPRKQQKPLRHILLTFSGCPLDGCDMFLWNSGVFPLHCAVTSQKTIITFYLYVHVCVFGCCTSCLLSVTFTFQLQCFVIIACCSSGHVFYVCGPNGYKKNVSLQNFFFFAGLILRVLLITSSTQNRAWHPWVCLGH
jgi:hypothetical protein